MAKNITIKKQGETYKAVIEDTQPIVDEFEINEAGLTSNIAHLESEISKMQAELNEAQALHKALVDFKKTE